MDTDALKEFEDRLEVVAQDKNVGLDSLLDLGRELETRLKEVPRAQRTLVKKRLFDRSARLKAERCNVGAMIFWTAGLSL